MANTTERLFAKKGLCEDTRPLLLQLAEYRRSFSAFSLYRNTEHNRQRSL